MSKFIEFCKQQHDINCNQKYDKNLPYSFHLNLVAKQVEKFQFILNPKDLCIALNGAWGHDLIEDARITYNDILQYSIYFEEHYPNGSNKINISKEVAEVIYSCTELKGKNRKERHGIEYIMGLKECRLGLFVKLCDIIANTSYGLLTNSTMYNKYQEEYPIIKKELYREEFKPMFEYLEQILNIKILSHVEI